MQKTTKYIVTHRCLKTQCMDNCIYMTSCCFTDLLCEYHNFFAGICQKVATDLFITGTYVYLRGPHHYIRASQTQTWSYLPQIYCFGMCKYLKSIPQLDWMEFLANFVQYVRVSTSSRTNHCNEWWIMTMIQRIDNAFFLISSTSTDQTVKDIPLWVKLCNKSKRGIYSGNSPP